MFDFLETNVKHFHIQKKLTHHLAIKISSPLLSISIIRKWLWAMALQSKFVLVNIRTWISNICHVCCRKSNLCEVCNVLVFGTWISQGNGYNRIAFTLFANILNPPQLGPRNSYSS